jgi:prevent-host-death family protein
MTAHWTAAAMVDKLVRSTSWFPVKEFGVKKIGLFEAKTNLSKIVEEVKRTGKSVTLTKRGEPYADIVPHQPATPQRKSQSQVIDELHEWSRSLPKSSLEQIKADISEGRH